MPEISEKLLVAIEVTQRRVEKQLASIAKKAAQSAKGMEDDFARANKRIVAGAGQAATALERINKVTGVSGRGLSKDRARDVEEYGRELDRLRAKYNPLYAASKQYETELDELNRALAVGAVSADEHGAALTRLNGRYQAMAVQGTTAATKAFRANRFETANVAAQLNDIGVQLASGQSPFLIAVQQGTQLNQIFGGAGGLRGSLGLLAGAFGSLINPVSLATIAIIGLGGAAVQYIFETEKDIDALNETLKQHEAFIRALGPAYENALERARQYAQDPAVVEAILGDRAKTAAEELRNTILAAVANIDSEIRRATSRQEVGDPLNTRFGPFIEAIDKLRDGTTTVREFQQAVTEIGQRSSGLAEVASSLRLMVDEAANAETAVQGLPTSVDHVALAFNQLQSAIDGVRSDKARSELDDLKDRAEEGEVSIDDIRAALGALSATQPDLNSAIGEIGRLFDAAIAARQAIDLLYQPLGGNSKVAGGKTGRVGRPDPLSDTDFARRFGYGEYFDFPKEKSGKSGRSKRASEAEREQEAVKKLIADLEFELSVIGLSNEEREKEEALRKAGASATEEQKNRIVALTEQLQQERAALEANEEAAKFFKDTLADAFLAIVPVVETGNKALDNLLNTLIQAVTQAALLGSGPLAGLFGGGGGILGAIFGFARGGIAAQGRPQPIRTFARGGVSRSAAIFGEAGPEAAVPLPDGRRIPVDLRIPELPRSRSTSINMPISIDARNADAAGLARVESQLRDLQRSLPRQIDQRVNTREIRKTRP